MFDASVALVARFGPDSTVVETNATDAETLERLAALGRQLREGDREATFPWSDGSRRYLSNVSSAGDGTWWTVTLDVTGIADLSGRGRTDALTGLASREQVLDRLAGVIERLEHDPTPVAVAVIELDEFDGLVDRHGRALADSLLVATAERLDRTIRAADVAGRLGGGNFAVVFGAPISESEATVVAERLLREIRAVRLPDHPDVALTGCVGVAFATVVLPPEQLLDEAAKAVDLARLAGRGRFAVVDDDAREHLEWTRRRSVDLRMAIEHDQFELRYQPVIALADGSMVGVEALVRWQHPTDGLLLPDEFVSLAERTGLIGGLTERVLKGALRQLGEWQAHRRSLVVSVNVSASDLLADGFAEDVLRWCVDLGADPTGLRIELTETAVLAEVQHAIEVIARLRSAGVTVALDDFGTGYATLATLRKLPLDSLKIDQSFVAGLPDHPADVAVVKLVIGLAEQLGVTTVAEGVETEAQRDLLTAAGCTYGQGFLFSQPVPADQLAG